MHNHYSKKLDALERNKKLKIFATSLLFFGVFLYLMFYGSSNNKSTQVLEGKLIGGNSSGAKAIFQNCTVELANKTIVAASCQDLNQIGGYVKVLKTVSLSNEVQYSVCSNFYCEVAVSDCYRCD